MAAPLALVEFTRNDTDLVTEMMSVFREHEKFAPETPATILTRYLRAGIAAGENYVDRDMALTHRVYEGDMPTGQYNSVTQPRFDFHRGRATFSVQTPNPADSTLWVDANMGSFTVIYQSADPKARGFSLLGPSGRVRFTIDSGFPDMDSLPPDMLAYMLAIAGAQSAVTEFANYTASVQEAKFYPVHLLDSWAGVICV